MRRHQPLRDPVPAASGSAPSPTGRPTHRALLLAGRPWGDTPAKKLRSRGSSSPPPARPRPRRPLPVGQHDILRTPSLKAPDPRHPGPRPLPAGRPGPPLTSRALDDPSPQADTELPSPSPIGRRGPQSPARARLPLRLRLRLRLRCRFTRTSRRERVPPPPSRRPSQHSLRSLKGEAGTLAASEGAKHSFRPAGCLKGSRLRGPLQARGRGPGRGCQRWGVVTDAWGVG